MRTRDDVFKQNIHNPEITQLNNNFVNSQNLIQHIVNEKINVHESLFNNFTGVPSNIIYFSQKVKDTIDNSRNNNAISSITSELKKYTKINNLDVLISDSINFSNEGDDIAKSYTRSGQLRIYPNTIVPYTGDYFIWKYLQKDYLFVVKTVEKDSAEYNSSFLVEFEVAPGGENFNYSVSELKNLVTEELFFESAHLGTQYKTILSKDNTKELNDLKSFYNFLGEVYINYFFEPKNNIYVLKNVYFNDSSENQLINKRTNINNCIYGDDVYYDNFLNYFIRKNNIFTNIKNKIVYPATLLNLIEIDYLSSIFDAVSKRDKTSLSYTFTESERVDTVSIFIPANLYGFNCIKHVNYANNMTIELFPKEFFNTILNFNSKHLKDFSDTIYNTDTYLMIEIIAIFLDDALKQDKAKYLELIKERLIFLSNRKNKLLVDNVLPQYIFYLYPIIAFIINNYLEEKLNINNNLYI